MEEFALLYAITSNPVKSCNPLRKGLPTNQQDHKDFFISYNGADQRWAEWIAWQLEEANYSVILQAWDFLPGSNFVV